MALSESNMAEFRMAAIIKLSQNEQVKVFFVQNGWIQDRRFQDGCHHQFEWEVLEWSFFEEMAESKMAEFKMAAIIKLSQNEWNLIQIELDAIIKSFVQHDWIQDGRIQYGCHHLVSQIELVWVGVRMEWECFWVNLRKD